MLLTITSTTPPATDLGYLVHKHPERVQEFELSFGKAHLFFPERQEDKCTLALLLEMDAVGQVRKRRGAKTDSALEHYVNDRPYVANSFLSVALAKLFREAMGGRSASRPELAQTSLPLTARIEVVNCRNGETFLRELFEPLGYTVTTIGYSVEGNEDAPYFSLQLSGQKRLNELLTHLYVLMPVLDNDKHYWIGDDEVEKLLRRGEHWLAEHPLREVIVSRYLQRRHHLTRQANARLLQDEEGDTDSEAAAHDAEEAVIEKPLSLHQQRLDAVLKVLLDSGARRVLDLGCGEGRLLRLLIKEKQFQQIVGMDVSTRALEHAAERLHLDEMHAVRRERIELWQGALTYRDDRLNGFDAAAVVEVIEHLDLPRLAAFEKVLFQYAAPRTVIITTPNRDYNSVWESLPAGILRHKDHRFEWTRAEFQEWAKTISNDYGYQYTISGIGEEDDERGAPTQMAVFTK